jgi:hypothetical protein
LELGLLEQSGLAAVAAEVAGIEDPPAVRLNQQRIRVEGGMIDEVGRHRERTDPDRNPVLQMAAGDQGARRGREERRGTQHPRRLGSDVDGSRRSYVVSGRRSSPTVRGRTRGGRIGISVLCLDVAISDAASVKIIPQAQL